jgi:acetyl-CoA synthetase
MSKHPEILNVDLRKEFERLSSLQGNISEKMSIWKKIIQDNKLVKQNFSGLYQIWLDLFKNDPLPVAWMPDQKESSSSNLSSLMKDCGAGSYNELHNWSVNNRSLFWEKTIKRLDILFQSEYDTVLNLDKGVEDPVWLEGAKMNIVESCFLARRDQAAIIQGSEDQKERSLTYRELLILVNKIASGLVKRGFRKGDCIILYLPFTIEAVAAYLAIVKAGMIVVSVADSFSPAELKKRIEITKAKGVFTCDSYLYGGKRIEVLKKVKEAEAPAAIVLNYGKTAEIREGDILFDQLPDDEKFSAVIAEPDAVTNILFSSGTTKEPKAIPWTHITPIKCAADGYYHQNIKEKDVVCWTTGMGWMMAPWLIYATLINKGTIALFTGAATSEKFGHFIESSGVTVLGTIPSVVKAWKGQGFLQKFNWTGIKVFSSTGEPSNQEDYFYLMAMADFQAPVIEYCGGTEIGGGYITGTVLQPASPATFTSPALGISFYLLKPDLKAALPGEGGEVFIVPPSIGLTQKLLNKDHHEEYYKGNPPGPNGEVLRKHGDAFDTVEFLDTIFYKSTGRVDDAMNLGGIKVSAVEIEEVLNAHENIFETAAISVPSQGSGPERLIIYCNPKVKISDKEVLKKELQSLLTAKLNPLFRISELIEVKSLPRTASNKLMRRELRKEYMGK